MYFFSIFIQIQVLTCSEQRKDKSEEASAQQNGLHDVVHIVLDDIHEIGACNDNETPQHMTTTNEPTPSTEHNSEKQERFKYEVSCFCPTVIEDFTKSRKDFSILEPYINVSGIVCSLPNNVYYILFPKKNRVDEYFISDERSIANVKVCTPPNKQSNINNSDKMLQITTEEKRFWYINAYPLFSDAELMLKYYEELILNLKGIMSGLFGNYTCDCNRLHINFATIREGEDYKMFYRVLEEMNAISYNSKDEIVNMYHEKALMIYKGYIVGLELLGVTSKRLQDILTFSCILVKRLRYARCSPKTLVDVNLSDQRKKIYPQGTLDSSYLHCELMFEYYRLFCEKLQELDTNLKMQCPTKEIWVENMQNLEIICHQMSEILIEFLAETRCTTFYEGKCTFLRVFVELRECIFKGANMKSQCIFHNLYLFTYFDMGIKTPIFDSSTEKSCHGIVKAENFIHYLDFIKYYIKIIKPEERDPSFISKYLKTKSPKRKCQVSSYNTSISEDSESFKRKKTKYNK